MYEAIGMLGQTGSQTRSRLPADAHPRRMGFNPSPCQEISCSTPPNLPRNMKRGEEAQVDALLRAAFGGPEEAELVAKLRKARLIAGEQVMPMRGADSRLLCAFIYGQTQRLVVSGASGHRARCAATWVWQAHDRHV